MSNDAWGRPEGINANEAEAERHVLAREAFVELYLGLPEVNDLTIRLARAFAARFTEAERLLDAHERDAWRGELVVEVNRLVSSRGPFYPWLVKELALAVEAAVLSALVGIDPFLAHELTSHAPPVESHFRTEPGESLESAQARWNDEKRRIESQLRSRRGKRDSRSSDTVPRDVGWYFASVMKGKSIRAIAREAGAQRIDVRRGIERTERLLTRPTKY